jgi:hypothetical protein
LQESGHNLGGLDAIRAPELQIRSEVRQDILRRVDEQFGAYCGHPICSYFQASGELGEPELCGSGLDTAAGLAMQYEALIEGGASFGNLR